MFHPYEYAGPVRIPPPKMQIRMRKEASSHDSINARQFESWMSSVPIPQGGTIADEAGLIKPQAYDMAPLSSRTDKRDYRQAQPFVADGPSLAMNPYFDRYDPTRDPRNMIREMRGAVYEEKEADRGLEESQRIAARGFTSRWLPEGTSEESAKASLMSLEVMRPKMDDFRRDYRAGAQAVSTSTTFYGSLSEMQAALKRM